MTAHLLVGLFRYQIVCTVIGRYLGIQWEKGRPQPYVISSPAFSYMGMWNQLINNGVASADLRTSKTRGDLIPNLLAQHQSHCPAIDRVRPRCFAEASFYFPSKLTLSVKSKHVSIRLNDKQLLGRQTWL